MFYVHCGLYIYQTLRIPVVLLLHRAALSARTTGLPVLPNCMMVARFALGQKNRAGSRYALCCVAGVCALPLRVDWLLPLSLLSCLPDIPLLLNPAKLASKQANQLEMGLAL